ncbi:MAG: hypothetical protein IKI63_00240 [Clostridia bacterium]|nr:hypothetical protein [Clostridia bacterium]
MQKRLLASVVAVFMLATCLLSLTACGLRGATSAAVGNKVGAVNYIFYGDVNSDGNYDMKDVLLIRRLIAGAELTGIDEDAADANADGSVDMKDVLYMRRYIAHDPSATMVTGIKTKPSGSTTTTKDNSTTTTSQQVTTTTKSGTPTTYINQEDPVINFIDGDETLGVWWWHDVGAGSNLETAYLDLLEKNHFTEIYFYSYSKMFSASSRAGVHAFVQKALARGMRVSILFDDIAVAQGGSDAWNRTVSGFLSYKQEFPNDDSFYGIHCDIEPRASTANIKAYVDNFIPKIIDARSKGIQIEVDLNCGWESWGRDLVYNGVTGIYNIIAHNVDTMTLMSYADLASSILGMSYYPFEAAKAAGTKVVFGIELGNSGEGDKVDFSQESKYEAYYELYMVDARLKNQDLEIPYGYAIHHMRAYYSLRPLPPELA